jgi:Tol biopolymer transport system component
MDARRAVPRAASRVLALALAIAASTAVLPPAAPAGATFPALNGRIAFVSDRDGNHEIYVMNADGSNQRRLTNNSATDTGPRWSPDGARIAFTSNRNGDYEIYVMDAGGGHVVQLTHDAGFDSGPAWSPDGSEIVFTSNRSGTGAGLYVMNADGTDVRPLVTVETWFTCCADWSPDGSTIAFVVAPFVEVFFANVATGGISFVDFLGFEYGPSWSPDGSQIAFYTTLSNGDPEAVDPDYDIFVMNPDGTGLHDLTDTPWIENSPVWSPDGEFIAFAGNEDGDFELYAMNANGSDVRQLTSNADGDFLPSWQPLAAGDANADGVINARDAALILQFDAGLLAFGRSPAAWDVNGDGAVDSQDAALVLQYAAALLESWPP